MNRLHVLLLSRLLWSAVLFHVTSALAAAQSNPTVVTYELVSTARITRTVSSFTYRVRLNNPLPHNLAAVQATVTSRSAATQVIDGSVTFGDVLSAATVASLDTITIQHDRTVPFNSAILIWSVGVRLAGPAATSAHGAIVTLPPVGADPSEIKEGVILSRLDVFLAADATVGNVNAALNHIGARIVSMAAGGDAVTVAVPPQPGIGGLQTLAQTLMAFPGIRLAIPGLQSGVDLLHASNDISEASHLVPARFPAAWNAGSLVANCEPVPLVIQDQFRTKPAGFDALFPGFPNPGAAVPSGDRVQDEHGYHMFAVAAAPLGTSVSPGTNPFINCVSFKPIHKVGTTLVQELGQLALGLPSSGKFVISHSLSLPANCKRQDPVTHEIQLVDCDPQLASQHILPPLTRAFLALEWKKLTDGRRPNFLAAVSASNERNDGLSGVTFYPGLGRAANASPMAVAAKADPLFAFALDASQWQPAQSFLDQGFASLLPDPAGMDALRADVRAARLEDSVADNVVLVGGLTALTNDPVLSPGHDSLEEADFSNSSPDVKTVAENVAGVCASAPCPTGTGNSRAAPQVAGLAAYLWALSPDLRAQPASAARRAIVDNARQDGLTPNILDAYATVLSLDPTSTPDPETWKVRRHILDVNTGGASAGRFDENDIAEFLSTFFVLDGSGNVAEPQAADFSRYDLNGDGFTGGSTTERFDLDRFGSTRFGATNYQQVTQDVEGNELRFDEHAVTDLDILCFYAYSPLYAGDLTARRERLQFLPGSRQCVFSVRPGTATVSSGQTVQFEASSPNVVWTATGGTISNTGLFTANGAAGTVTVRATSTAPPHAFAEASVDVIPVLDPIVRLTGFIRIAATEERHFTSTSSGDFMDGTLTTTMSFTYSDEYDAVAPVSINIPRTGGKITFAPLVITGSIRMEGDAHSDVAAVFPECRSEYSNHFEYSVAGDGTTAFTGSISLIGSLELTANAYLLSARVQMSAGGPSREETSPVQTSCPPGSGRDLANIIPGVEVRADGGGGVRTAYTPDYVTGGVYEPGARVSLSGTRTVPGGFCGGGCTQTVTLTWQFDER